jgi:CDP-glucose 4,6-dehydratase
MTNTVGTANILEATKYNKHVKCLFIITTDKVYQNYESKKYFDENSKLGGDDIYSGSKACCEILANSYRKSFFKNSKCRIVTVRAGNCFGGGDWTKERIVKDSLECFYNNKTLTLRMPEATRPWQHVIEPLFGYILLVQKLCSKNGKKYVGAWNFGPSLRQNLKVIKFAKMIKEKMNSKSKIVIKRNFGKIKSKKVKVFESKNLSINSSKVFKFLNWSPFLSIESAINLTIEWYKAFKKKQDLFYLTKIQILNYIKKTGSI